MTSLRGIGILLLLLVPSTLNAAPAWVIRPTVCLADKPADTCTMTVTIQPSELANNQRYCLFLGDTLINCWLGSQFPDTVNLRLSTDNTLLLVDDKNETVLAQELEVKARQKRKTRRRIRQPWSLF